MMDSIASSPPGPSTLAAYLANPDQSVGLQELAHHWFHQIICVKLKRPAVHDDHLLLLNRIRGAWGVSLKLSASHESIAGRPCTFDPPCAFDIFFREQLRIKGKHGIPKPFVLSLDIKRNHFEVQLTVFGIACDWLEAARERLVEALRYKVKWSREERKSIGSEIVGVQVLTYSNLEMPALVPQIALDFLTPFDATGTNFLQKPSTLIARLARRIDGLSRWMGIAIDAEWQAVAVVWNTLEYGLAEFNATTSTRGSRRQGKTFKNPVNEGCVIISGDLAPVWPLLVIGQSCHVGRGAAAGLGKYELA